jgi:hypothetical protein
MQVYVKGASKKALNEKLALNERIGATEYSIFNNRCHILNDLPTGTVIKVYDKIVGGNPYAKSYGVWNKEKNKIA